MKTLLEMVAGIIYPMNSQGSAANETGRSEDLAVYNGRESRWTEALMVCEFDQNAQWYLDLYGPRQ